jgi:hypothetical protein
MSRPVAGLVAVGVAGLVIAAAIAAHTRSAAAEQVVRVHTDIDYLAPFSVGSGLPREFANLSYLQDECWNLPPPEGMGVACDKTERQPSVGLAVPGGVLLGDDRGEWGGELVFKPSSGQTQLVVARNTHGIALMPFGVVAFVGMAHGRPTGSILLVERKGEAYHAHNLVKLAGTPVDVARTDDGDLLFRTIGTLPQHEGSVFSCHLLHADRSVEDIDCLRVRSDAPRLKRRQASPAEVAACAREMFSALANADAARDGFRIAQMQFRDSGQESPTDPEYFEAAQAYDTTRKALFELDRAQHARGCSTHLDDRELPDAR